MPKNTSYSRSRKAASASGNHKRSRKKSSSNTRWKRLSAQVSEEASWVHVGASQAWSRAFMGILLLHVVIVGGILIYEWMQHDEVQEEVQVKTPTVSKDVIAMEASIVDSPKKVVEKEGQAWERYRVKSGDTLLAIAKRHDMGVEELMKANATRDGGMLELFPGLELNVRKKKEKVAKLVAQTSKTSKASQVPRAKKAMRVQPAKVYQVQAGDTLYGIARKFSVSAEQLIELNDITDPSRLALGQSLTISK